MLTSNDLQKIGEVVDQKLDQKLKPIHKKIDKIDKDLNDLKDYVVPSLGSIFEWTDDIHTALVGKKSSKPIPEN
jgi:hypothetical protein